MLQNYLKIALRNLVKQKLYAFVNIFGLAVGLACVILILVYVRYELSFDRFHENADRIFRIVQRQPGNTFLGTDHFAVTPAPLASTLVDEYPEVTHATSISNNNALLSHGDVHFYEEGLKADAHLFEVFTFPMIHGTSETALAEPNTIVLTESLARKIFGDDDPVGQTLIHQNQDAFTVTGVIEDVPDNAHFTFAFITSLRSDANYMRNLEQVRWNNNSWFTYFLLEEGSDYRQVQAKMQAFTEKYLADDEDDLDALNQYYIQPLTDIHLRSHVNFEIGTNNDIKYIYLFSAIALVILLIACVNYMNLATARSITRAQEVGMRKVVGAHRWQLIKQFIGESILLAFLALLLAMALVLLLLPVFGGLVERDLSLGLVGGGTLLLGLLGIGLVVGFVAGSYPALFMSALRPVHVLKGSMERRAARSRLQSLLVVGQYAISILLIAGSLIIYQQLRYIQNKEIGYNRDHVVVLRIRDADIRENKETIKSELQRHGNVRSVTFTSHLPTRIASSTTVQGWEGSNEDDEVSIYQSNVDYDFLDVFELKLTDGRMFSPDFASDTTAFVINETAVKALGWSEGEGVGKRFKYGDEEGSVIGVLKDFHMHSLHQPIEPLMLRMDGNWFSYIAAKVRPDDLPQTLAFFEETMGRFTPWRILPTGSRCRGRCSWRRVWRPW